MKTFFILFIVSCVTTTLAAPEAGYSYNKELSPVIEHGNLNGFKPIAGNPPPCSHAAHNHGDSAIIQSQSIGRILNHQPHHNEHSLETAASGYSPQSQAVTVNSHIVVGDSGTAASSLLAGSQEYRPGQGYVQAQPQYQPQATAHQPQPQLQPQPQFPPQSQPQFPPQSQPQFPPQPQPQFPPQPPQFNPLPQLPLQLPAQPFNPGSLPLGRVVPAQVISGQTQGYTYAQGGGAAAAQHIHHHYTAGGSTGAVINGVGKVPPPPPFSPQNIGGGHQYAANFGGNRFAGPPHATYGAPVNFGGPAPYRPPGPVIAGPIGNVGAPRPVQHFGSASNSFGSSNSFAGSNSYAGSFGHNSHNTQYNGANQFGGNTGHATANFGASQGGAFDSGASIFNTASSTSSHNNALNGQLGHVIRETFAHAPLDPTVEKHIYVHVPPEDLEEGKHSATESLSQTQPKKHYKIIFIKAPTVAQPNYAQLAAATQQSEEKTLVYVLVKKPDEPSIEELQQIQQSSHKSSKPEVYFIKYKTRKENEAPTYTADTQFAAGGDQFGTTNQFANIGSGYNSVLENNNPGGYTSGSGSEFDGSGSIDIRLNNGESSGVSTSTSYSTSSSSSSSSSSSGLNINESSGPKHELYGVPLE